MSFELVSFKISVLLNSVSFFSLHLYLFMLYHSFFFSFSTLKSLFFINKNVSFDIQVPYAKLWKMAEMSKSYVWKLTCFKYLHNFVFAKVFYFKNYETIF